MIKVRRSDILDSKRVLRAVLMKRSEGVGVREAFKRRRRGILGLQRVLIARVLRAVVLKRSEGVGVRKAVNRRRRDIPGLQRVLMAVVVKRARVMGVVFLRLVVGLREGGWPAV